MRIFILVFILFSYSYSHAQDDISKIISALLSNTPIEEDLFELTDKIGGRVTGSDNNKKAVEWAFDKFKEIGLKPWKEDFLMSSYWYEHVCSASVNNKTNTFNFEVALVSKFKTPAGIMNGNIKNIDYGQEEDFKKHAKEIKGNIVLIETDLSFDIAGLFAEYTLASQTEALARKYGASGIIYMSSRPRGLLYRLISAKGMDNTLPQFIMSRADAKRCQRLLVDGEDALRITIITDAEEAGEYTSHNILAEIKGTEYPNEIILLGAHLDSWALGTGANDNGCNVSMMLDIARQMVTNNIRPKRTIRFALWNGEEQGYFGSWDYTKEHLAELDDHIMTITIDIGSGGITGFFTNGRDDLIPIVDELLKPVSGLGDFYNLNSPIIGTDNFDFMTQGVANLVGNQKALRYGIDYHASSDTYDKVDLKSLKTNSAIVGTLALGFSNMNKNKITWKRHSRKDVEGLITKFNLEYQMRMFNVWDSWADFSRGIK